MKYLSLLFTCALTLGAQNAFIIDLTGEWRQSPDDQAQYAQPDFDDRHWAVVRLPWQQQPEDGVHWLRRSVELPNGADQVPLSLTLGPLSPIYEVYANGRLIGTTGPFLDNNAVHTSRSRTFPIPRDVSRNARLTLAIRTRSYNFASNILSVFRGGEYLIVDTPHVTVNRNFDVLNQQRIVYAPAPILAVLLFTFAFLLGLLWLTARNRTEPFWLGLILAFRAFFDWSNFHFLLPDAIYHRAYSIGRLSEIALIELCLASVAFNPGWFRVGLWGLGLGMVFMDPEAGRMSTRTVDVAAIFILLIGWWRNGGIRQALVPHLTVGTLALLALTRINSGGAGLFPAFVSLAGYQWSVQSLTTAVFTAILTTLLVVSLGADRREKQRLAGELEAARNVQQLLVSGTKSQAGYLVDAVYEPAQEVGGDFYQVLPTANGDLLVVVGDVSGKGLKAALVVSMMAGVVRSHVDQSPAAILAAMNRVLGEGSGGFVTAIAILLEASGNLTLANAGHLQPYRDGVELPLDPGLPLGVTREAEYAEVHLQISPGEAITLLTDGIVEAENPQRELFGFDRTREISAQSAQQIADAAKAWGQNDDITVVTVRRTA